MVLDPVVASRVAQAKMNSSILERKSRLDDIDKAVDETLNSMTRTVNCIEQPSFAPIYRGCLDDEMFANASDMVARNSLRREEEMHRLDSYIDRLTRHDNTSNYRLRSALGLQGGDVVNDLESLRKRQNETTHRGWGAKLDRITAQKTRDKPYSAIDDVHDDVFIDYIRRRELAKTYPIEAYGEPLSVARARNATISPVQERVYNRAKQLTHDTSEIRRINERSKYLNVMSPAKKSSNDFNLMVMPEKARDNIDHMAKSFALGGIAHRKYEVREEIDEDMPGPKVYTKITASMDHPYAGSYLDNKRSKDAEYRAWERTTLQGLT